MSAKSRLISLVRAGLSVLVTAVVVGWGMGRLTEGRAINDGVVKRKVVAAEWFGVNDRHGEKSIASLATSPFAHAALWSSTDRLERMLLIGVSREEVPEIILKGEAQVHLTLREGGSTAALDDKTGFPAAAISEWRGRSSVGFSGSKDGKPGRGVELTSLGADGAFLNLHEGDHRSRLGLAQFDSLTGASFSDRAGQPQSILGMAQGRGPEFVMYDRAARELLEILVTDFGISHLHFTDPATRKIKNYLW